jgi:hypothetical protein
MKVILTIFILFLSVYSHKAYSQGCSDAGFCSIDGIKQDNTMLHDSIPFDSAPSVNTLKTGLSLGNTRYDVWIINPYLSYSRKFNDHMAVSVKLDGQYRMGQLTHVAGFSDITLSMSYKLHEKVGVIAGGKIPLSNANRKYKGISMPMAYQTSLGSYDAIVGAQYAHKNLFVVLGWQQPLIQNANSFMSGSFSEKQLGATYPETNTFLRSGDVLLRVSYRHKPKNCMKKFLFTYSLLPIYHLKNDRYTNAENKIVEIRDSQGLTFNTNIFVNYYMNSKTSLELSTGFPLLARQVRPEGLSQFAVTIELIRRF